MHRLIPVLLIAGLLLSPIAATAQEALPIVPELGLESTRFATGLDFPVGMAALPDGSVLVATSPPSSSGYYDSTGEILRLTDINGDGLADEPYQVVATDLPGSLTALALTGDLLWVTSTDPFQPSITALRRTENFAGPYEPVGSIDFAFQNALHTTYGLAARPTPGDPATWQLFFNIGAHGNDIGGSSVELSGLIEETLPDSAVYMATIHDDGNAPVLSRPIAIATGIRNTSAMAFDPASGDLWIAENGIDGLIDPFVALSADELDIVPADAIGGETIDFGFPSTYTRYDTGEIVGTAGTAPFTVFLPLDGSNNEGVASLAFAPVSFPDELRGGLFAGFHGQFDLTGVANDENPLLWIDSATGEQRTIVSNDAQGVGHLDTLLSTPDALYVADMCADGSLGQVEPCGAIYRITVAEAPFS